MTWVTAAVVMGGAQVASGLIGANAAGKAADKQAQATLEGIKLQKQMFDIQNAQQAAGRGAGYQGLNLIRAMLPGQHTIYDENGNAIGTGIGTDYFTHQFNAEDFANNIDPGYAWRLQQGEMANQRAANVGGGALSGNTLAGLQAYTQGQASQEYNNAYNRYTGQRKDIYNTLAGIAGLGQTAQGQANQAAQSYGANATNLMTSGAQAQAAGTVGAANAISGGIQGAGNAYMLSQFLGNKFPTSPAAGGALPTGYGTPAPQLNMTLA